MRPHLVPPMPALNPPRPPRPGLRAAALASLAVGCAVAALGTCVLLSHALPSPGALPIAMRSPGAAAPTAEGDTSVPDAATALRGNLQWETEAPDTF